MAMQLGGKGLNSSINVTPLVDVMLVLLIIFMVITPMLQKGKAVQLPTVPTPEKQGDNGKDIVVSLEYTGGSATRYRVYLGQFLVEESSLRGRLEDELRKNPAFEIYLKGDARLTYGAVRKVMEVCHSAGFGQVKLATEELKAVH
ncbi:MAG: biopolymer transporter ExbD [Myxococcales bacterium]